MLALTEKKARWWVLIITFLLMIVAAILAFNVKTNYDMTTYLPKDSMTKEGLLVLDETFGNHAKVELMVEDINLLEAYQIKQSIMTIDGVLRVVWLDDFADITAPATIDPAILTSYYRDEVALFTIIFEEDNYALEIEGALDEIRLTLNEETIYLRGEALDAIASRDVAEAEFFKILMIIIPICIIILIFASASWLEPFLILLVLGIAVLLNLGTNALLPNVSFITLTIAAALQLAISLDYSLFFIHRYYELVDEGLDKRSAVSQAFKKSWSVITASALTTMIGFVALFFMRYRIGFDIGVVLSKGILFSYLTVLFVLPVLIVIFAPWLEKFRHRSLMFNLHGLARFFIKARYALLVAFIVILGLGIFFQTKTDYLFGAKEYTGSDSTIALDKAAISDVFGDYQSITLLLKNADKASELALLQTLAPEPQIVSIDALYTLADPMVPESALPSEMVFGYLQGDYRRITLYVNITEETDEMFSFQAHLSGILDDRFETYYALGFIPSTDEIRTTVIEDTPIVLWVSVGLIALVLVIVFKNLLTAILLISVIQAAIWFNVGLLAINDRQVIYIGYLVVLALQLGATIDYAVLFASRYKECRQHHEKADALGFALTKASMPIMISGLILASAGFTEMLFSDIIVVSDIGLLLGRGALLSLVMVLFVLPGLIYLLDPWISRDIIKKQKK